MGNMVGGGNLRNISSSGGLSIPGLSSSRLNLAANSGYIRAKFYGTGSQVMSMLGNSYHTGGGPLSQNHAQSVNNMMLSDHSNDSSLFDINNDFSQRSSRPGSASGNQGQLGSASKMKTFLPYLDFKKRWISNKCVIISLGCSEQASTGYPMSYCSTHFTVCQKTKHIYTQQMNFMIEVGFTTRNSDYGYLEMGNLCRKGFFFFFLRAYGKETKLSAEIDFK
ncbi:BnaA10g12700D [Brassica napus]|uniref:BnaA10g12700D protein n=1 Tax=Brassica napus TaxID=3708 RepID=A0A078IJL8_BRANA|nr:BnaA10g12700D [Brassica napus]